MTDRLSEFSGSAWALVCKVKNRFFKANILLWIVGMLTLAGLGGLAHAAQERYEYDPIGRLIRFVDTNNQVTDYTYDAAGNLTAVVKGGSATAFLPTLTSVTPNFLRRGETKFITLTGQRLQVGELQTSVPGLDLRNVQQTATQIQANISATLLVPVGPQLLTFANAAGSASVVITVGAQLPVISVEPSPLALPPDNATRAITVRLSSADLIAHTINIASSDPLKAVVSPASVTIAPGQTSVQINVTSRAAGFVNLTFTSTTLQTLVVPVFITTDFRGVNTSYAMPVGVVVGDAVPQVTQTTALASLVAPRVGIAVGAVLTTVSPQGVAVASTQTIVIRGSSIAAGAQVSILPSDGVSFGVATVAADGSQISVGLAVDASAAAGVRRLVVADAASNLLPFADPSNSQITITTGQPAIASITPFVASAGSLVSILVRGSNLHNGRLLLTPSIDLRTDTQMVVNSSGTELTAKVQLSPLAATGPRLVQIVTPSGASSAQASSANQFTIVSQVKDDIGPIFAQPVGVMVGTVTAVQATQSVSPITAPQVGLVVGAHVLTMTPRVAVVGTTVNVVITGQGLQNVLTATFVTPDGLTASAFAVSGDGTQLTLPLVIDAAAAKTLRRVVLATASGPLPFARMEESTLLVAAPVPVLVSVSPQVIKAGTTATLSLRGQNFRDVQSVRFEPAAGLNFVPPSTASADGTALSFVVQADANAITGARTVIVVAASGESSSLRVPENTVYVAQQVGPTYSGIIAPPVGIVVGTVTAVAATDTFGVYAPSVGVVLQSVTAPVTADRLGIANNVGVVVGTAVTGMTPASPEGFMKGSTNTLTINGVGLDQVTSVSVQGTGSFTVGTPVVNGSATQLTVPVGVALGVLSGRYGVVVSSGQGTALAKITATDPAGMFFSVGALPTRIDSVSPIVMEQGKSYAFTVRGANLQDVYRVLTEPDVGFNFGFNLAAPLWSTDALGEKLTLQVSVDPTTSIGSRVVRLKVPGGVTDATPTPANTITVVAPQ